MDDKTTVNTKKSQTFEINYLKHLVLKIYYDYMVQKNMLWDNKKRRLKGRSFLVCSA